MGVFSPSPNRNNLPLITGHRLRRSRIWRKSLRNQAWEQRVGETSYPSEVSRQRCWGLDTSYASVLAKQCQRHVLALPGKVTFGIAWNCTGASALGSAGTLWYLPWVASTSISACSLSRYQELNGAKVQPNFPPVGNLS